MQRVGGPPGRRPELGRWWTCFDLRSRREGAGGLRPGVRHVAREARRDRPPDQQAFLQQAIAGLAQDGKVICVRLALFAEMMKGKPWIPSALKQVGGTEGVASTFLEETFSASTAPPEHRYHQKAARAVLKALLPESGTNIQGHMRSYEELLEASGYASRPQDFDGCCASWTASSG